MGAPVQMGPQGSLLLSATSPSHAAIPYSAAPRQASPKRLAGEEVTAAGFSEVGENCTSLCDLQGEENTLILNSTEQQVLRLWVCFVEPDQPRAPAEHWYLL